MSVCYSNGIQVLPLTVSVVVVVLSLNICAQTDQSQPHQVGYRSKRWQGRKIWRCDTRSGCHYIILWWQRYADNVTDGEYTIAMDWWLRRLQAIGKKTCFSIRPWSNKFVPFWKTTGPWWKVASLTFSNSSPLFAICRNVVILLLMTGLKPITLFLCSVHGAAAGLVPL